MRNLELPKELTVGPSHSRSSSGISSSSQSGSKNVEEVAPQEDRFNEEPLEDIDMEEMIDALCDPSDDDKEDSDEHIMMTQLTLAYVS